MGTKKIHRLIRDVESKLAKLQAARPIRLDKGAVRKEAKSLNKKWNQAMKRKFRGNEPLGDGHGRGISLGNLEFLSKTNVAGQPILPAQVVISVVYEDRSADFVLGGAVGKDRSGDPILVISVNGKYTADALSNLEDEFYNILIHEGTHLVDVIKPTKKGTNYVPSEGEVDLKDYYNKPEEVRAYMQEIADEVIEAMRKLASIFPPDKVFKMAIRNSHVMRRIEPHLTPKNKKLVMKSIYTAVQDEGLI